MRNHEARLKRLEDSFARPKGPCFVTVRVEAGESKDIALARALREDDLDRSTVAQVLYSGPGIEKPMMIEDLMPGAGDMELAGRREYWDSFYRTIRDKREQRMSSILAAAAAAEA